MQLIIAEKPSVARDIARVLGVRPSGQHSFAGTEWVITWCVGHLVELEEPAAYDARWKSWRLESLPMLPATFKLRASPGTHTQFEAVARLLTDRRFRGVVNACDAGREGELIFRYVYDLAGSRLPIRRLWISSMTDEAIRAGFAQLRAGEDYAPLAAAARCRSEADWLVGLNATRAVTVRYRVGGGQNLYSIGRVQTPTLALLVERERAIRQFVPRDYWEVRAQLTKAAGGSFRALWTRLSPPQPKVSRLGSAEAAEAVVARCASDALGAVVESLDQKKTREPPPLLFDLTSLQRTANRRFGLSATRTLEVAQALYERHKLLTYPRTDARHLSHDMIGELPKLFGGLAKIPDYTPFARPLVEAPPLPPRRVFDDKKVHDHHAIVPTGKVADLSRLERDERRIFDMVARRFLGAFYPDAEFANTELVVRVGPAAEAELGRASRNGAEASRRPGADAEEDEAIADVAPPPPDRFLARGRIRLVAGWQVVAGFGEKAEGEEADGSELPLLAVGEKLRSQYEAIAKQTKPPPRHTEGTLLAAMETAGRHIEDEELRAAMKEAGLGTPATRASIIETLVKRGFAHREGKSIAATDTGMALVAALPVPTLASPELTGRWEARLSRIARGEESRESFMHDIADYVTEVVEAVRRAPVNLAMSAAPALASTKPRQGAPPQGKPARVKGASASPSSEPTPRPRKAQPAKSPRRGGKTGARGGGRARPAVEAEAGPRAKRPEAKPNEPGLRVEALACPRCRLGRLVRGNRGWGCTRWREGCAFVIWFEMAGRPLPEAVVVELVTKGKTRKSKWPGKAGGQVAGRLVLDLEASRDDGAARLDLEEPKPS